MTQLASTKHLTARYAEGCRYRLAANPLNAGKPVSVQVAEQANGRFCVTTTVGQNSHVETVTRTDIEVMVSIFDRLEGMALRALRAARGLA